MSVKVKSTWVPLTLPDTVPITSVVGVGQVLQIAEKLPEIACPDWVRTTSKIAAPSFRDHVPVKSMGGVGVGVTVGTSVCVGVGVGVSAGVDVAVGVGVSVGVGVAHRSTLQTDRYCQLP